MAAFELSPSQSVQLLEDAASVARAAVDFVSTHARRAIAEDGVFRLVLAGGTTPMATYDLLRHVEIPWQRVEIFFGDERCLPIGDPGRNDTMAIKALLSHVPIPLSQIHAIPAELGPTAAAVAYAKTIKNALPLHLVILGMGEDGHTASLFPGQSTLKDEQLVLPVYQAPKPPPERVSLGFSVINGAMDRLVLIAGGSKARTMARLRDGELLPVSMLGPSYWLIERVAWGES